jgi:hypothetical protein
MFMGVAPARLGVFSRSANKPWMAGTSPAMIRIKSGQLFFGPLSPDAASVQGENAATFGQ